MATKSTWLAGLAGVLVLTVGAPAVAQVGGRPGDRGRDQRAWTENQRSGPAYDNGYRRGLSRGEQDGRARRSADFRAERDYRSADWGYNGRFGPRESYRLSFRVGFEAGYYAGYGRYGGGYGAGRAVPRGSYPNDGRGAVEFGVYRGPDGRYGAYGSYGSRPGAGYGYGAGYGRDIAFQNGYRDGLEKGREDLMDRDYYDVMRHRWYRNGDHHYEHEYGPREQVQGGLPRGLQAGLRRGLPRRPLLVTRVWGRAARPAPVSRPALSPLGSPHSPRPETPIDVT